MFADINPSQLTDHDQARLAFLRSSNMLWALADPERAKVLIDEASRITPPHARIYIDAFLTVYWFATDQPEAAMEASRNLALEDIPVVGAEIAWVLAQIRQMRGASTDAVAAADAGYSVATRSLDAPHMRFNIADAEISALLLAGRVADALDVAERMRQQAANLPGAAQVLGAAVAGRAALGAGDVNSACLLLERAAEGLSVSHAIGWGYRYRLPQLTALAICGSTDKAAATLLALEKVPRRYRLLDYERSLARAWVAACQGGVSEAINGLLAAAERRQPKGNSPRRCYVCRPLPNSAIEPARRGCASSKRSSKVRVRAWPRGSPSPCATMMPLNCPPYQKNSNTWAILLVPSMRPLTPLSRIAARASAARLWVVRHAQTRWPNNAAHLPRHFVGPPSPRRSRIVKQRL